MLGFVVISRTFTFVFGLDSSRLFVGLLEVGIDVLGDAVNLIFDLGEALNPL